MHVCVRLHRGRGGWRLSLFLEGCGCSCLVGPFSLLSFLPLLQREQRTENSEKGHLALFGMADVKGGEERKWRERLHGPAGVNETPRLHTLHGCVLQSSSVFSSRVVRPSPFFLSFAKKERKKERKKEKTREWMDGWMGVSSPPPPAFSGCHFSPTACRDLLLG